MNRQQNHQQSQSSNIMALIISKNKPKSKSNRKSKITKIGLIKILSKPNTTATISAVVNRLREPVIKLAINKTKADVTRIN
jgi:hypothetical protein